VAVQGQQLLVSACFDNVASVQHNDSIGMLDG
jgi:hypothetical protein